jgi:hypothetical protein
MFNMALHFKFFIISFSRNPILHIDQLPSLVSIKFKVMLFDFTFFVDNIKSSKIYYTCYFTIVGKNVI